MPSFLLALFSLLPALGLTAGPSASPKPSVSASLQNRNNCAETLVLICYGTSGGEAQNISINDIAYAAAYLRSVAEENSDPLWTMPPEAGCSEWTIPIPESRTLLALAKHVNPRTNSSVTYYDLARTLDGGGADGSALDVAASLLGACGANGGQMGVTVDADDPAYKTTDYVGSGAKHQDIIIKLVRNPKF
ncbi:hypothetical protein C8A03DRAFT_16817 [Achaetomium macrosporum]|uniref:Uncharacterized protein n=1 Tax=Achaetomium macrosporum TaxID=79813 RepID=A0AAN7C7B6_9PEZI|nr:hypothetical protein C8A03DRAFT_16817 [Achaetomium macrosporum]